MFQIIGIPQAITEVHEFMCFRCGRIQRFPTREKAAAEKEAHEKWCGKGEKWTL